MFRTSIVESKRLKLRPLESSDIDDVIVRWTDSKVMQYMGGPRDPKKLRHAIEASLAGPPKNLDIWPVIEKSTNRVVGDCGFTEKEVDGVQEIELIYVIGVVYWRNGYASEMAKAALDYAFEKLGLNRVICLIDPQNVASEKVAKNIGMKHEKDTIRPSGKKMRLYSAEKEFHSSSLP